MELMARNPDGTFQQGDPETRQAAQKGGQASHGQRKQSQMQQQNRQQGAGQGQGGQQAQSQQVKKQMGSGIDKDDDSASLAKRND